MSAPVTLFIGDRAYSSWSLRAWLALSHANVAFTTKLIRLDAPDSAAQLANASPVATVPVVRAGDQVIWDSLAIAEWANEQADGALWPADPDQRACARALAATFHSSFGALRRDAPMNLHRYASPAQSTGDDALADRDSLCALWRWALNRSRRTGPYLMGEWSLADAMAAPYATRLASYSLWSPDDAAIRRYADALFADPAHQAWDEAARADPRRLHHVDRL